MVDHLTFVGADGVPFQENVKTFKDINRDPQYAESVARQLGLTVDEMNRRLGDKGPDGKMLKALDADNVVKTTDPTTPTEGQGQEAA